MTTNETQRPEVTYENGHLIIGDYAIKVYLLEGRDAERLATKPADAFFEDGCGAVYTRQSDDHLAVELNVANRESIKEGGQ